MKKTISIFLIIAMLFCFAACQEKEKTGCYVTIIGENGKVELASEHVDFVDYDKDGKIILDEVLKATHAQHHKDGEKAYVSLPGDFGLYMTKFWNDESGAFGYYVNNQMAMNLETEIKENDYVAAYIYQDPVYWSDAYSFFDKNFAEGKDVTLSLKSAGFDENWNTVLKETPNAVITIDGQDSEYKTDASGNVSITGLSKGTHVISAKVEGIVLVSPVCKVTVK